MSLERDPLLVSCRARLAVCRRKMRRAWLRHLRALREGDLAEIELTREEYESTEPPFDEAQAAIARRLRLLTGGIGVGERVRCLHFGSNGPLDGIVIAVAREFRVWWSCERKWTEMQDRYYVRTARGDARLWIDELSLDGDDEAVPDERANVG